jgi:hypothetical protein
MPRSLRVQRCLFDEQKKGLFIESLFFFEDVLFSTESFTALYILLRKSLPMSRVVFYEEKRLFSHFFFYKKNMS